MLLIGYLILTPQVNGLLHFDGVQPALNNHHRINVLQEFRSPTELGVQPQDIQEPNTSFSVPSLDHEESFGFAEVVSLRLLVDWATTCPK